MKIRKSIHLYITSVFMLGMILFAKAENSQLYNNHVQHFVSELLDEKADKIISNVKVAYNPIAEQLGVIFKLSKQSVVVIKLMDALGNEVMNLSNSTLESGSHSVSFDTQEKISEGIYFIRVSTGSEIVTKRVLIK